jgi:alkylation response protein AidB-like acyl-CoA dehydrogenase
VEEIAKLKRGYWGAAVNPRDPGLTLTPRGTDYVLNGRKSFSTAVRISDYINANASLDGKIANFAVPTDRPGYIAHDDWDNIGQRLSDSGSVEFRDFPVYAQDLIAPPAEPDAAGAVLPTFNTPLIQLVFVNFYLGTAEGALAAVKVNATHVSLDITARVFELTGARSTASTYRFDRFWRNVRTHTLHDPVFYKAREVGDFALNGTIPTVSLYS